MRPKNFKERLLLFLAPPLVAWVLRALTATWRFKEAGQTAFTLRTPIKHPRIYAIWHESVLCSGICRGQAVHALTSRSFDGELISRAMLHLGWLPAARGSSSRGGGAALTESRDFLAQNESMLYSVDGPRGPRRVAKDGAIQLARLSGCSVVPIAFACAPGIRLKSWDRMVIPLPFTRAVLWFGPELRFPDDNRSDGDLQRLQEGLDQATNDADLFLKTAGAAPRTD